MLITGKNKYFAAIAYFYYKLLAIDLYIKTTKKTSRIIYHKEVYVLISSTIFKNYE